MTFPPQLREIVHSYPAATYRLVGDQHEIWSQACAVCSPGLSVYDLLELQDIVPLRRSST